jgi:S1-C subfamily serine protease
MANRYGSKIVDVRNQLVDRKYMALLAAVAGIILVLGTWARPKARQDDIPPMPSPADSLRLQRMTQLRNIQGMTNLFLEAATHASRHLVWVPDSRSTALIWDVNGTILAATAKRGLPEITLVNTAEQFQTEARRGAPSLTSPLVSLRVGTDDAFQPVQQVSLDVLSMGDWLVAVAKQENGSHTFAPGIYGGSSPITCGESNFQEIAYTVNFSELMLGGGLFDLNGFLVGIIVRCNNRLTAIAASDVPAELKKIESFESQLLTRYGFRVDVLAVLENANNSWQGAKVTEVWVGRAADLAGIRPGDHITEFNGTEVKVVDDLFPLVFPPIQENVELRGKRDTKKINFVLSGGDAAVSATTAGQIISGIGLGAPRKGVAIDFVVPNSPAARAGLQSGDVVLWIDGRSSVSTRTLIRLLNSRSKSSRQVVAERKGRMRMYELR